MDHAQASTYIFPYAADMHHYTADAFVVRCFDNRFWKPFHAFIKHLGLEEIDTESVAGGAKVFASPEREEDRDFMLRELEKSIRLHGTKRVILFTHHDCGAYGGSAKFDGDIDKERAFHTVEHQKARTVLEQKFSDLTIETYFLDENGVIATN